MKSRKATHQMMVTVDMVVELDPDRVEEWVRANFDADNESVTISDLTRGNGVSAPVVFDEGPEHTTLAQKAMDGELDAPRGGALD